MKGLSKKFENTERSILAYDDALYAFEAEEEAYCEEAYEPEEEAYCEEAYELEEEVYYEEAYEPEEEVYYEEAYEPEEEVYYEEAYEPEEEAYYEEAYEPEEEAYYEETYEAQDMAEDSQYDADELLGLWSIDTSSVRKKKKAGMMDLAVIGMGALALILMTVIGIVYANSKKEAAHAAVFSDVGTQVVHIDVIGEKGLLAVADAWREKEAAEALKEQQKQEELEKEQEKDYDEIEYDKTVAVALSMTSVKKDLKIKFTNKETGKLIANAPFSVTVTKPDNKSEIWSDEDMDGIIYRKEIDSGNYKIAANAFTEERYGDYVLPIGKQLVDVKKDIVYKKIDVSAEVKKETESEAKVEDTKKNETVVESQLQDTVAWIESTSTANTYIEVLKSQVPDPVMMEENSDYFVLTAYSEMEPVSENRPGRIRVGKEQVNVTVGRQSQVQIMLSGYQNPDELNVRVESQNAMVATAFAENNRTIVITGESLGQTVVRVYVDAPGPDGMEEISADITVFVTGEKMLTMDMSQLTLLADVKAAIGYKIENATGEEVLKVISSDETVATVAVEGQKVMIAGWKEGSATITLAFMDGDKEVRTNCVVTVKKHPKNNVETKLTDEKGNQIYVIENNVYREAVYADYYSDGKFFIKGEVKYTGWQVIEGKVYFYTAAGEKVTGEQIIQGAKYHFAGDGSLITGSGTMGIDISKWNGKVDWEAVKNSGVSYVIIRCGYRGSSNGKLYEDQRFEENIKGATKAGLKVGVYFFTQATDEVEAIYEASFVLDRIKNYKISYPVFLDVEASNGRGDKIDKATRTAVCKAFCQTIQNAGYTAGIYANKTWLENKMNIAELGAYKIWLAQYVKEPTYAGRYDMWQYTCTGKVGGVSGDVDLNLSYIE